MIRQSLAKLSPLKILAAGIFSGATVNLLTSPQSYKDGIIVGAFVILGGVMAKRLAKMFNSKSAQATSLTSKTTPDHPPEP